MLLCAAHPLAAVLDERAVRAARVGGVGISPGVRHNITWLARLLLARVANAVQLRYAIEHLLRPRR